MSRNCRTKRPAGVVRRAAHLPSTVDFWHMGYRVRSGHRLRLQLASSEYPEFVPNPGTVEPAWTAVEFKASDQTLTCGAATVLRLTVLD